MLYNSQLTTFIEVAEAGSFRRAAEKIGISPSAVLKQIMLLEQSLEITLFDRSRKGVALTEAGASIYRDAKYIRQYSKTAVERAREIYTKQSNLVRIGVSAMTLVHPLVSVWPEIQKIVPELRCRFTSFDCSKDGIERSLMTLGQDSDLILGVYDEQFLKVFHLQALKLGELQPIIAEARVPVSEDDALPPLTLKDLEGRTVLLPRERLFEAADAFRRDARAQYPSIRIEDFDMYSLDVFYQCQQGDCCIFSYDIWHMGRMLLRQRRTDWEYKSSFGILYPEKCSEEVTKLIDAVRTVFPMQED